MQQMYDESKMTMLRFYLASMEKTNHAINQDSETDSLSGISEDSSNRTSNEHNQHRTQNQASQRTYTK